MSWAIVSSRSSQLGRAVLVEERDRRAVLDRLLEVVDAHVVAEDLAGALLPRDEGRAREGDEERVRQRRAHVHRELVVLRPVRLVDDDDDVRPRVEHLGRLELVDQREDVAVVLAEQLPQVRAAGGVALRRVLDRATRRERLGELLVQLDAIGDEHEGPVAGHRAQELLGVEDHREALARALGLPEDARPPVPLLAGGERGLDGVVHAEELMVLPRIFASPLLCSEKSVKFRARSRSRSWSHVPRSSTSSDTRRGSSSRSMRFQSKKRPQSAVSEPTLASVPFEAMSSALKAKSWGAPFCGCL
jgi:hypothetical protein